LIVVLQVAALAEPFGIVASLAVLACPRIFLARALVETPEAHAAHEQTARLAVRAVGDAVFEAVASRTWLHGLLLLCSLCEALLDFGVLLEDGTQARLNHTISAHHWEASLARLRIFHLPFRLELVRLLGSAGRALVVAAVARVAGVEDLRDVEAGTLGGAVLALLARDQILLLPCALGVGRFHGVPYLSRFGLDVADVDLGRV
jgi:hypothetical protein